MTKLVPVLALLVFAACRDGGGEGNESTGSDAEGTTTTATTGASATGTSEGETTDGDTSAGDTSAGDTTTGEVGDAYDGVWCGNASAGVLAMGSTRALIDFHGAAASPVPIVGWADDTGQLMFARYDVASASWLEPDVVATDFPSDSITNGRLPVGAVSPDGDAWIAYGVSTPEPHVVVHRFEMATETWTREDLPEILAGPRAVGMVATSTGHAALFAADSQPMVGSRVVHWFFDPDAAVWTPGPIPELDPTFLSSTTLGASDPTSGDILLATSDDLAFTAWRYVTATQEVIHDEIATEVDNVEQVIALGDGAFVVVTSASEFYGPYQLQARHFDGTQWQPAVALGSGGALASGQGLRIVGDVGRVGVAWTEYQGGAFATMYTTDTGWLERSMLQASDPSSSGAIASARVALDDAGIFVVWAALTGGMVTPRSSYFDGKSWSPTLELDPNQQTAYADLYHLDVLGPGRARVLWERHNRLEDVSLVWACHTPSSGWSEPVEAAGVRRLEPRADGEVLVVTVADSIGSAEYFAAAD